MLCSAKGHYSVTPVSVNINCFLKIALYTEFFPHHSKKLQVNITRMGEKAELYQEWVYHHSEVIIFSS